MKCAELAVLGLILALGEAAPPDSASRSSESFEAGPARKRTNRDDGYGGYSDDYHGDYASYGKGEHDYSHGIEYGKSLDAYSSQYSAPQYYNENSNSLYAGHDYVPSTHATYDLQKSLEYSFPSHDSYNHYAPLVPHPPQLNAHHLAGGHHSYNYNDIFGPPFAPTLPLPTKTTVKTTKQPKQQNNNILSALLSISSSSSGISKPASTTQKPVQPAPKAHVYSIASYPAYPHSGYPAYHTGHIGYPEPRLTLSHGSSSALY